MLKTALVTGANKGIGYFIAKGLLQTNKFRVILGCRNNELGKKAADQLCAELNIDPNRIIVLECLDLTKVASIQASAAGILAISNGDKQPLDVLINNAGFAFTVDATEPTGEQARVTVGINYFGTKEVCKYFIPLVKDGGRVINVSSRAGLINNFKNEELIQLFNDAPKNLTLDSLDEVMQKYIALAQQGKHIEQGWPATTYQTSKIAESALTRLLAIDPENQKRNLKICCYTPGYCKSDMTRWADDAKRTAEQGAETAVWFASDESGEAEKMNGLFLDEEHKSCSYFDGKIL